MGYKNALYKSLDTIYISPLQEKLIRPNDGKPGSYRMIFKCLWNRREDRPRG